MTIKSAIFFSLLIFYPLAHATILTNPPVLADEISHWASSVSNFSPGPQDINTVGSSIADQGVSTNALGPRDSTTVSLGDGGSVTLAFDSPISNIDGPDFAVFENGFGINGLLFAELGFVSVSSDGINFATFTTIFDNPELDDSFGSGFRLIDVNQTNNFAGVHASPAGTGFELSDLLSDALVTTGLINLEEILFVRITDAIGDGSTVDSFGNSIFDPYPTNVGSGGFDLNAIGAIAPVPIPAGIILFVSALLPMLTRRI